MKKFKDYIVEYEIHHDGHGNYYDDEGNKFHSKPRSSFARRHTITSREPDHPHSVHINGKKWKTFGSHSHASNVAKKIKGATVHKEETKIEEGVVQFTKHKVDTPREITGDDVEKAWAMKVHAALDDKISYQHNGITLHHKNGDTTFVLGGHKPIFDRDAKGKLKFKDDLGPARAAFKFPRKSASKNNVVSLKKEEVEQIEQINELSSELLARYKHNASLAAQAADKAKKYDLGHKRFKGIMKATFKQFANDAKK